MRFLQIMLTVSAICCSSFYALWFVCLMASPRPIKDSDSWFFVFGGTVFVLSVSWLIYIC